MRKNCLENAKYIIPKIVKNSNKVKSSTLEIIHDFYLILLSYFTCKLLKYLRISQIVTIKIKIF